MLSIKLKKYAIWIPLIFLLSFSMLSYAEDSHDPLEGYNRAVFSFNDAFDRYFFKPVATFYNKVMPKPLNRGIHNAFQNINTITTVANDLLQLHLYQMTSDLWRLALNTTIGIGGLFDVAKSMGLEPYQNDFGITLARWGWQSSSYFVIPILGPSSIRDLISWPVDYYAFSIYPYIHPVATRKAIILWSMLDARAYQLQFQNVLEEIAVDKYSFYRNAYLQRRAYLIAENKKMHVIAPNNYVESAHN